MYAMAQKENASVKLPNSKLDPGTERRVLKEMFAGLLPRDIIANAFATDEARKNIHAKPMQLKVTNQAIATGILTVENRSLKKSYTNM